MKTVKYHAAYGLMDDGVFEITLCPDRACAEVVLGQHKISGREIVGITNRPASRHRLVRDLEGRGIGRKVRVRMVG